MRKNKKLKCLKNIEITTNRITQIQQLLTFCRYPSSHVSVCTHKSKQSIQVPLRDSFRNYTLSTLLQSIMEITKPAQIKEIDSTFWWEAMKSHCKKMHKPGEETTVVIFWNPLQGNCKNNVLEARMYYTEGQQADRCNTIFFRVTKKLLAVPQVLFLGAPTVYLCG